MKGFKKLILTSAILAASSSAFAMQAMDDESMSAATGQDGLTITLDTNLSGLGITYVDRDGVDATYNHAGAVVISPIGISTTGVQIDVDAGGDTGDTTGTGMLQIQVTTPNNTVIDLGGTTISVADANDIANGGGSAVGAATPIISFDASASLTVSGSATPLMTIQLANEDQGAMIQMAADISNVSLTGMTINDANSGGSIGVGTISVSSLHLANAINVTNAGLTIDTTGTTVGEVGLENVQLGTVDLSTRTNAVGDIYITGLAPTGTITVSGH